MKILKRGKSRRRNPWIGKTVTCPRCRCKFKLEAGDKVEQIDLDGDFHRTECPECHETVSILSRS